MTEVHDGHVVRVGSLVQTQVTAQAVLQLQSAPKQERNKKKVIFLNEPKQDNRSCISNGPTFSDK